MAFNWNQVTAVFGGTFDPPHRGHREAVRGLFVYPGVRRVLVIPSGTPPFKPSATSNEHRFEMTKLAFSGLADVQIDAREIARAQTDLNPSYTIDTISELKRDYSELAFVVGTDQLEQLPRWHRFRELLSSCHWIVMSRKPDGEAIARRVLAEWQGSGLIRPEQSDWTTSTSTRLTLVPTEAPALASVDIRGEIAREADPEKLLNQLNHWLLPEVLTYLMIHRIYGMPPRR